MTIKEIIMLIRFSVENYKSFKERQIFSMVAGKQTRHPTHCLHIDDKQLLKSSFFFGANASGKSNFVRAIDFMRTVVVKGTNTIRYSDRYFRIDPEFKNKPGVFQIDFLSDGNVYSYGFAINHLTHEIKAEWLYRIDLQGKEQCIFERQEGEKIQTDYPFDEKSKVRFEIYSEDVKPEELLLSVIGNKDLVDESGFADYLSAYKWFKKIEVVYPESHARNRNDFFLNSASSIESLANMLRLFDTGIDGVGKVKQLAEKAFSFLPEEIKKDLLDEIAKNLIEKLKDSSDIKINIGQNQFDISIENGEIMAEKIMFDHGNKLDLFELSDESDGTKRLVDLLPLYDIGKNERVIIVDELDRSLHSKLTQKYIELFFKITADKPSQLICTTHDVNLINLELLRQDEIWFVERGKDHASRIYSLSDYSHRSDKNVMNDYLLGRYGAIPHIDDIEFQEEMK